MPKKSEIYENEKSKRRVSVQIRSYDSNGNYESNESDITLTKQIKNVTAEEVEQVLRDAFGENYSSS